MLSATLRAVEPERGTFEAAAHVRPVGVRPAWCALKAPVFFIGQFHAVVVAVLTAETGDGLTGVRVVGRVVSRCHRVIAPGDATRRVDKSVSA